MIRYAVAVGLGLAASSTAHAFDYLDVCGGQPTRWPGNTTNYQISTSRVSNELSLSSFTSQVESSFDEWSRPGCSAYNPVRGSNINADPGGQSSANIVGTYESGWPAEWGTSTIGITLLLWSQTNCVLSSSDMVFNGQNFTFSPSSSSSNSVDFRSVATHEAGHWAGMDHSSYRGSSLWASYSGGTAERDLTCDDTEAICGNAPSGGNSCINDNYCACGVSCEGGTCSGSNPVDPGTDTCSGPGASYVENEPNDWTGESDVDYFVPSGGGDIVISGQVACGNNGQSWTSDRDWFVVDLPCTDDARFTLDWTASSDLDFWVYDTSSDDPFAFNAEGGTTGPVSADAYAGGRIFALVMCWDGPTANYTLTVDRPPYSSTPDPDPDPDTTDPDPDPDTSTGEACGSVTFQGECSGDLARWCEDGELFERDCSNEGGCGLTDELGYYCLDAVGSTDTGDPLPLFPGCACSSASGLSWLGALPMLLLAPLMRRRRLRS